MTKSRLFSSLRQDRGFYRVLLSLMIPVVLQQAINIGVNLMDTLMLGSFGEAQLSASSLANSFYSIFIFIYMGVFSGCSVLSAQYWGAGKREKVVESFSLALRLALLISLIFALLTAAFPAAIMRLYTTEADVIAYGVRYLRITAWIYVLHGCGQVLANMMRTVGKAHIGFLASAISFAVNIFANWVFIFGRLGAPRLEIAGAALGTLIARIVELAVVLFYVFTQEHDLHLRPQELLPRPGRELLYNYLRLGLAAFASDTLLGVGTSLLNTVLGRMGAAVVAANAICQLVDRLFTVVVAGVNSAASVMIGNAVGRGDREAVMKQGRVFYLLSVLIGLFCGLLVLCFGSLAFRFFSLAPETHRIGHELILVYAFITVFFSMQGTMTKGVLRGGGDTRFLLRADILFLWVLSLPLGYVAGLLLHAPAWLTVLCLRIDYIIKSFWCIRRFKSGAWIHETKSLSPNV